MKPYARTNLALFALSLTAAALSSTASSANFDGKEGGGGAGLCTNGKCMTLAQAGLQIKEPPYKAPGYLIPSNLVEEIREIVESLPWKGGKSEAFTRVLGKADTFQLVQQIDPKRFRKAMDEYRKVIENNGFAVDSSLLTLFAFSDYQHTYLLPKFFELTLRQQALYLIHELHIRSGSSLEDALKFDIQLENWNFARSTRSAQLFDPFRLAYYGNKLGWAFEGALVRIAIQKTEKILHRPLSPTDLCENFGAEGNRDCEADRASLARLGAIDLRLANVFSGAKVFRGFDLQQSKTDRNFIFPEWFDKTPKSWPELDQKCARSNAGWVFVPSPTVWTDQGFDTLLLVRCAAQDQAEPTTYFVNRGEIIEGLNFLPLLAD